MEGPVIKFGQFTVAQLLEHFFISAQPPGVESQALRFMFAVLGDELPKNTTNQAVQNTATQEIAIEKIEFRFDMLREHAENFLPRKHKPDMARGRYPRPAAAPAGVLPPGRRRAGTRRSAGPA